MRPDDRPRCPSFPMDYRRARPRSCGWLRAGSATARSARRCSSASTPPPTTSAASCARPVAPTGPRLPRTPTGIHLSRPERRVRIRAMPLYMIERSFAEQLELTGDDVKVIEEINSDEGVRWLFSFLSADRRRTYCLYEAPSSTAILEAARRANVPADEIVEVEPDTLGPGRAGEWAATQPAS